MSDELPEHYVSSGNIFADLGLPDAEELMARAKLMLRVTTLIEERGLTQARAAELLGTNQPTVSDLMRGKITKFSLSRLISFLNALGQEVQIKVTPRPEDAEGPALVVTSTG